MRKKPTKTLKEKVAELGKENISELVFSAMFNQMSEDEKKRMKGDVIMALALETNTLKKRVEAGYMEFVQEQCAHAETKRKLKRLTTIK